MGVGGAEVGGSGGYGEKEGGRVKREEEQQGCSVSSEYTVGAI